jgi:hypothetical protein
MVDDPLNAVTFQFEDDHLAAGRRDPSGFVADIQPYCHLNDSKTVAANELDSLELWAACLVEMSGDTCLKGGLAFDSSLSFRMLVNRIVGVEVQQAVNIGLGSLFFHGSRQALQPQAAKRFRSAMSYLSESGAEEH